VGLRTWVPAMSQRPIDFHVAKSYIEMRGHDRELRVLVCGSRTFGRAHHVLLEAEFAAMPAGTLIIHGGARGADEYAGVLAGRFGFKVQVFPADWSLGRRAGPLRNSEMLRVGPHVVLAAHDGVSRGTLDTMMKARLLGIPVRVITFEP
jgi:hypothetical protein